MQKHVFYVRISEWCKGLCSGGSPSLPLLTVSGLSYTQIYVKNKECYYDQIVFYHFSHLLMIVSNSHPVSVSPNVVIPHLFTWICGLQIVKYVLTLVQLG